MSNNLGVNVSSEIRALKVSDFKPYHSDIVQKGKAEDQIARMSLVEFILQKMAVDPTLLISASILASLYLSPVKNSSSYFIL